MSQVPWHAITSLVDDLDQPFFVAVQYGSGYQYYSGILRTFDILGNITMSDGEEHIFHNGFHASRKMNKLVTIFGDTVAMCGRYTVCFLFLFSFISFVS